ncbi:MAG: peptidoglycan bridge formation glycyltransferase FemA/FemB family protein [Anaerolineae bacterium]|nr:peptidoglycan bridge formation glycyltransferase FemA/FemB family protein [Anaerolineae bacterium]
MDKIQGVELSDAGGQRRWNALVAGQQGHLLQAWEWGEFKASLGWQVKRILITQADQDVAGAQVLFKKLPVVPLTIAYIPKGPVVNWRDRAATAQLFAAVHQVAQKQRAIFLTIEPDALDDAEIHASLEHLGFLATLRTNQPRSTIVVDLSPDEAALLAAMRKKTRKLVRQGEENGLQMVEGGFDDLDDLYQIMAHTARRKGHSLHGITFFEQEWRALQATGVIHMLLARHNGQVVAAKMVALFGERALHLWGGVSDAGRELSASYFLQWKALQWAKSHGCHQSDLWGIPDEVGALLKAGADIPKDRTDDLWGVYIFKRGFGGAIEYYVGAYDYVYRPWLYRLGMNLLVGERSVAQISGWLEGMFGAG